jgi:hypothetical protein
MQYCSVCKEWYFRGSCAYPRLSLGRPGDRQYCYHDEAPSRYWAHVRLSPVHQAIDQIERAGMTELLAALPEAVTAGRAHEKLRRHPAFQALRKLLR